MAGTHQDTYLVSKEIALDWWKSLPPDAVQVSAEDGNSNRQPASTICNHEKDGTIRWVVWREEVPDSEVFVDAWQRKEDKPKWRIDVHWHDGRTSANRTTAQIVKQALNKVGAISHEDFQQHKTKR